MSPVSIQIVDSAVRISVDPAMMPLLLKWLPAGIASIVFLAWPETVKFATWPFVQLFKRPILGKVAGVAAVAGGAGLAAPNLPTEWISSAQSWGWIAMLALSMLAVPIKNFCTDVFSLVRQQQGNAAAVLSTTTLGLLTAIVALLGVIAFRMK